MHLRVRVQRHLCIAHRIEDPGDWAFTICRAGLQKLLNQKLKAGESVDIEVSAHILEGRREDE